MKHNLSKNPDFNPNSNSNPTSNTMKNHATLYKLVLKSITSFIVVIFVVFTIKVFYSSQPLTSFASLYSCTTTQSSIDTYIRSSSFSSAPSSARTTDDATSTSDHSLKADSESQTELHHVVFGLGAAAKHWHKRKHYIKFWWQPNITRGFVFLDKPIFLPSSEVPDYPRLVLSSNTSRFNYTNKRGTRDGLRITRIVSEMIRMNEFKNVRWFVMGDDDTVFFTENLLRVLRKYDHNQMYYIGANSETHVQNIRDFSYGMAYGGGGFAISVRLAQRLEKMQDRCIEKYPSLYGSDDRIQACLAELGVPLTKEPGFHQFDVFGNVFGLLSSHPLAPMISMHHLDTVEPIFPYVNRVRALQRLEVPAKLDSASLMQQSMCYDAAKNWTVSVSWGFAVQIYRGIIPPRELEKPPRTFLHWHKRDDPLGFAINTRPFAQHPCQKPFVYYYSNAVFNYKLNVTLSQYSEYKLPHPWCWWKTPDPSQSVNRIEIYKKPDLQLWDKAPRRNCCRVLANKKKGTMVLDIGECTEDEVIAAR